MWERSRTKPGQVSLKTHDAWIPFRLFTSPPSCLLLGRASKYWLLSSSTLKSLTDLGFFSLDSIFTSWAWFTHLILGLRPLKHENYRICECHILINDSKKETWNDSPYCPYNTYVPSWFHKNGLWSDAMRHESKEWTGLLGEDLHSSPSLPTTISHNFAENISVYKPINHVSWSQVQYVRINPFVHLTFEPIGFLGWQGL